MAEMSGQGANQRGFDEHYKNTKKVTVYFYSTANDIPVRVSSSNPLPVSATIDTTGLATTTTDTNTTAISTNIGAKADASATTDTGTFSLISLFKRLLEKVTTLVAKDFSTETTLSALNTKIPASPATSGKQDTGNTSLASLDTKLPAQGQALAAASTPVVLPAAQISTLTPPAAITGFATSAKQDTAQTALDAIKTSVETLDNAISGSEMQVDVVGALPAGTNAIGKLAANSGVDIGDVDVTSAVSATLDHGSNLDIDTSAEQITSTSFACKFGVTLKADITNTGIIYIGNSDVTAGTTAATDGFPLSAGETLTLEVTNANIPYAIASANNQKIYWVGV